MGHNVFVTEINLIISDSLEDSGLPERLLYPALDIRHIITETFGIDEARTLKEESTKTAFAGSECVFVIATKKITIEAQNALLKQFEDTPTSCGFYLVIPHESLLLPTLRSRFVSVIKSHDKNHRSDGEKFLALSYKERLQLIADKAKDNPSYLENLPLMVARSLKSQGSWLQDKESKEALLLCESYVRIRGASRKMLLENLALSLPVKKA